MEHFQLGLALSAVHSNGLASYAWSATQSHDDGNCKHLLKVGGQVGSQTNASPILSTENQSMYFVIRERLIVA
jgi:hypothetical protein